MTTPIPLGWQPVRIAPIFSLGQDWIVTFQPIEGSTSPVYPDGTTVVARIYADNNPATVRGDPLKTWPAEIIGDDVRFHVEAADVDTVAKGAYMRIMIVYPGTPEFDPYVWAKGKVHRDD